MLELQLKTTVFHSPTLGEMGQERLLERIGEYLQAGPDFSYRIVIGSDSQPNNGYRDRTEYISALVIHRVGAGGIYFWTKTVGPKTYSLHERMLIEALLSLQFAQHLVEELKNREILDYNLEIHVDIGRAGKTRAMINEVIGMIKGNGFVAKIKPDAYAAASVADRYT